MPRNGVSRGDPRPGLSGAVQGDVRRSGAARPCAGAGHAAPAGRAGGRFDAPAQAKRDFPGRSPPGGCPDTSERSFVDSGKRRITGEELRMKESYGEGVASHTGPEPCADACEGMGEASAGVRAGGALSRERRTQIGVPTPSKWPEGNTGRAALARPVSDPARSKTSRTLGNSPRRNWETPGPTLAKGVKVRAVNPFGARRR